MQTDEANAAPENDAVQPSQIIENTGTDPNAQGAGVAAPEIEQPKPEKPLSTREAIAKAFDESKAEVDGKATKAADDAKAKLVETEKETKPEKARDEGGKFAKVEKLDDQAAQVDKSAAEKPATGQEAQDRRQSEGRPHSEPPARFLPEARTRWANVPNEVKAEFHRVSQEMEGEIEKHRTASERYEQFRQFDEVAKQNGRDFATDSIPKVVQFENMMRQNPLAALEFALREAGPRKQDGSPISLYEISQHVVQQGPQAYSAPPPTQQQQPQQHENAAIAALRNEIQSMKVEQTVMPVIRQFADAHPDYRTLEPQIEKVLHSGVIDQIYGPGLSPEQKLTQAYRMAGGNVAPSRSEPEPVQQHSEAAIARPVDPDGQKSIKGAPTAGQTGQPTWVPKSNREALERAFAANAR